MVVQRYINNMKKIAIICYLDGFGNSIAPLGIKKYLEKKGHTVDLINTHYLSRFKKKVDVDFIVPKSGFKIFLTVLLEITNYFSQKYVTGGKINYFLLFMIMRLRASMLKKLFKNASYDFIICEDPWDSYLLLSKLDGVTIYHCQTPFAEELYFGGQLTEKAYEKLKRMEIEIYSNSDYLSFAWDSYGEYVKKYYNYNGKNIISLNNGTVLAEKKAKYNSSPKIVYFGYLGGYWINLPLLSNLTKQYKNIDVYGYPEPDKKYKLNYKGYATKKILSNYQFGLITITKDRLRSEGFSGKHIDYLSYGLPVLTPEWRKEEKLGKTAIFYNDNNFLEVIKRYSQKKQWEKVSKNSIKMAENMNWDSTLKPLDKIINFKTEKTK